MKIFDRFERQIGKEKLDILQQSHVAIFGLGGVGGSVLEALARSGIGKMTIVDDDCIDETNINRQLIATTSNIGKSKVDEWAKRLHDINPNLQLQTYNIHYPDSQIFIDFSQFDYVVDAVDDINAKILIIVNSKENNIPVISSMGVGNKYNPLELKVDDIFNTSVCPLAKIVRKKLKELNITNVKCVYSTEKPVAVDGTIISSNAFVPITAGVLIAKEVVFDLIK